MLMCGLWLTAELTQLCLVAKGTALSQLSAVVRAQQDGFAGQVTITDVLIISFSVAAALPKGKHTSEHAKVGAACHAACFLQVQAA